MLEPGDRSVHVWVIPVRASDVAASQFEAILSDDERARATRFRFEDLQRAFRVTRGALRLLLSKYLGIAPAAIQFVYDPKGKPSVGGLENIRFNLSHSGDLALLAFTRNCDIGIDVEQRRALPDLVDLANRYFSPEEKSDLLSLPAEQREQAFFVCWTRKEAYIKAVGDGLSMPLDTFRVTLLPDSMPRIVHLGGDMRAGEAWTMVNIELEYRQYTVALAYRDTPRPLRMFLAAKPEELLEP